MRSSILLVAFSALVAAQSSVAVVSTPDSKPMGRRIPLEDSKLTSMQPQASAAVTSAPVIPTAPTQGSLPAGPSSFLVGSSGASSLVKSKSASATSTKTSTKTSSDSSTSTSDSSSSTKSSSSSTSSGAGVPLATVGPVGLSVVAGAALAAFL
ncbi:hypothetical protein BO70DRAFT_349785 [Aspergillus heteromorphus CBS 117.55]|uniref:GPI anchored protein n=1 Tax=Aspergillus heteromorphus CBS 117.55 TaxID=1448321 RepID=A0A317WTV5_9EURO|nr:uncharacterized protein BO70DRAFT_349785 [Aspergillus heteromorphus CBS 117.55]PWY89759.1 hypothetical protein BO70DRAFT_349785 [Aspergillus heteromorphus CBS 117.55]